MKIRLKLMIYLMLPLVVILCSNQPLSAKKKSPEKKIGVGFAIGYVNTDAGEFSSEISLNASLFYNLSKSFRLELKITSMSSDIEEGTKETDFAPGKMRLIPLQFSLQYRIKKESERFRPYLTVGAGYYFQSYDAENLDVSIEDDIDNVFGFHTGIGLDYRLSSKMMFNLDFRYCFVKLTGSYTSTDPLSSVIPFREIDVKLNPTVLSAGFTYFF